MKVKFLEVEGGVHGGMMFKPTVYVYKFSPTKRHPRRFECWFSRPTKAEAIIELNRRLPNGWKDEGALEEEQ